MLLIAGVFETQHWSRAFLTQGGNSRPRSCSLCFRTANELCIRFEWLKEVHLREAALVLKTLELSESEEASLMERINGELAKTRLGPEGPEAQSDGFSERKFFS